MKNRERVDLRPGLGIGVVIGAGILLVSQASGSDPILGLVLGGGAGILLGLGRHAGEEAVLAADEEETTAKEKR